MTISPRPHERTALALVAFMVVAAGIVAAVWQMAVTTW